MPVTRKKIDFIPAKTRTTSKVNPTFPPVSVLYSHGSYSYSLNKLISMHYSLVIKCIFAVEALFILMQNQFAYALYLLFMNIRQRHTVLLPGKIRKRWINFLMLCQVFHELVLRGLCNVQQCQARYCVTEIHILGNSHCFPWKS